MKKLTKKTLAILLALSMVVSLCGLTALATGEEPAGIGTEETGNLQEGQEPAGEPTGEPIDAPTEDPAGEPTEDPAGEPTEDPAGEPTEDPAGEPTEAPTEKPTEEPTEELVPNKGPAKVRTAAPVEEEPESPVENLKKAATEGGEVTLTEAVTLDEALTIEKDLTISGGTINGTLEVAEGVTLTLDGVTITATAGPGIAVTGTGVTLEVVGTSSVTSIQPETGPVGFAGVEVPMGTSLTITGNGTLNATAGGGAGVGGSCDGGVEKWINGDITVDMGGTLIAIGGHARPNPDGNNGDYGGAGIGAASYYNPAATEGKTPGNVVIKAGTIGATGYNSCAGIGGGSHTPTGAISIEGGDITAISAGGAGIGSGSTGKGTATVSISGGTINATGGWLAAGIGGSYKAGGAEVTITGGDITAQGGNGNEGTTYQGAPGIGGGYQGGGVSVAVSGGKVDATGGNSAPGIGNGALTSNAEITIIGGEITAQGGCNASGIGGGNATGNVNISITGGTIDAKGGMCVGSTEAVPGIGSGTKCDANKTGGKYEVATDATVTIGPDAKLAEGTAVGAPAGNKFYECTVQPDGSRVYKTTEYAAETVALLISDENTTAYSDLAQAVGAAQEGDTVRLVANVALDATLNVNQAITLELNGKTLTLSADSDGLVGYGGCTIQNGDIVYTGSGNALRAENIALIDHVKLTAETAGVGVMVYGNGRHLDKISNSTITGAKKGISTYKVNPTGNEVSAIGEINTVVIDAKEYGVVLNLSQCGEIVNSDITGGDRGISFQWHNDNAPYPPAGNKITGGSVTAKNGPAIEFFDNRGRTGCAYTVTTEIKGTQLSGKEASTGALIYSLAKGDVKFVATVDGTNVVCSCENSPWSNEWSESRWFDSFASAVANTNWSSKPLDLLADVNETVTIGKRIQVNLNGHTLTGLTLIQGGVVVANGRVEINAPAGFVVVETEANGTYTYSLREAIPVTGITLNRTTASVYTGNTVTLTATVTPDNADDKTVTWTSSNEAVATVDQSGVVTARSNGTATITATVGGKSATCVVTVSSYSSGGSSSDRDDREPSRPTPSAEPTVTPAPSAEPTPTVEPAPAPSEEPLAEPDVPLAEIPEENLTDPEPPLAEVPDELSGEEDLGEPDVPLADVPKTGDSLVSWLALAVASGMGLAWLGLSKRKEDEA